MDSHSLNKLAINKVALQELLVFGLLLAIGVVGRWLQPTWNFTPTAAVTILGGFYFRHLLPAVLLPVSVLAISDLILPAHDAIAVQISVHVMMIVPLLLGRAARSTEGWHRALHWVLCGIVPSTAFFLVTNFAHWAFTSMYEKSAAGLAACYAAAVPFYRTMLAGDVFYLSVLLICLVLATTTHRRPAFARSRA